MANQNHKIRLPILQSWIEKAGGNEQAVTEKAEPAYTLVRSEMLQLLDTSGWYLLHMLNEKQL